MLTMLMALMLTACGEKEVEDTSVEVEESSEGTSEESEQETEDTSSGESEESAEEEVGEE